MSKQLQRRAALIALGIYGAFVLVSVAMYLLR